MARIIEGKRRMVVLNVDDVLAIVRQYQCITQKSINYEHTRELLKQNTLYLPEDV